MNNALKRDDLKDHIHGIVRHKIHSLTRDINILFKERERFIANLQASCSHSDSIYEIRRFNGPGEDDVYTAPFRVCIHCGLTEEGWNTSIPRETSRELPTSVFKNEFDRIRKELYGE